ncbi:sensor histidine kinase [Streptomyces aureus]|uniref:sensor histidine kinase n=1 Tax=Streptomyces aureus TaxID=193461 RepID=UPI00099C083F|nr:HAMP domain-containing sensor histidine kinase [Streptomyces aureus]
MTDTSRREQQPTVPPRPLRSPHVRGGAGSERPWQQSEFSRAYSQLRPTIRMRLTLLYGGMFLIAGVLLLLIIYLLAAQALRNSGAGLRITEGYNLRFASDVCPAVEQAQSGSQFNSILGSCLDHQRAVALDSLLHRSLLALMILAVVAFAFGYAMAGRVLSPLGRITRTARAVAGSDLSRRIELDGPDDELKELADTFDDMLERLERAFTAQQRFVGNASHELRTPLAINRTLLEVHLSDPGAPMELQQLGKTLLATNERSEQLVEGLLLLARSDNQIVERKPVGLAEVASQAIDQARAEAEAKGVEFRGERKEAVVQGNGVLLERIALNLVQNAIRYNVPEGGWVEVTTEARHGQAALVVSNTGPVVPGYEIDNLFEPFRRLRTERTGSDKGVGLGLSIVRSVARAHGGTVTAAPRDAGGLDVHVRLPAP